jgi:hypothetical protein
MGESALHRHLVNCGIEHIKTHKFIDENYICFDSTSEDTKNNNLFLYGNEGKVACPDFLFVCPNKGISIIGEAKTYLDMETTHSLYQYQTYVEYCNQINHISTIIFVVQFGYGPRMRSIIRNQLKPFASGSIEFIVVEA